MSLSSSSLHGPVLASFFKAAVLIAFCVLPSLPRRRWQRRISRRKASACMLGKMRLEAKDSCPQRRGNIWVSHFRDELESILTFWWRKQGSLWAHRQLMSGRIQDKKLQVNMHHLGSPKSTRTFKPRVCLWGRCVHHRSTVLFWDSMWILWSEWLFMIKMSVHVLAESTRSVWRQFGKQKMLPRCTSAWLQLGSWKKMALGEQLKRGHCTVDPKSGYCGSLEVEYHIEVSTTRLSLPNSRWCILFECCLDMNVYN